MTIISTVPAVAATIQASFASRSTRPLTMVPPVAAPHAQVSVTAWTTTATTVTIPNQRCAASSWSWPYRRSIARGRDVRTRPPEGGQRRDQPRELADPREGLDAAAEEGGEPAVLPPQAEGDDD